MEEWWVQVKTGNGKSIFWYGPLEGRPDAEGVAHEKYLQYNIPNEQTGYNTQTGNIENFFAAKIFFGVGRVKVGKLYQFPEPPEEFFVRHLANADPEFTNSEQEMYRVNGDDRTEEICYGPMIDDWESDCDGIQEALEAFTEGEPNDDNFTPNGSGNISFIKMTNPYDVFYASTVAPTQGEVDETCLFWSVDNPDGFFGAGGANDIRGTFGFGPRIGICYSDGGFIVERGYNNTNMGTAWFCPDSQVIEWLAGGGQISITFALEVPYPEYDEFTDLFGDTGVYLYGYDVKSEIFAQIVRGGKTFGQQYTARSQYDIGYYNQITDYPGYQTYVFPNTIYSEFRTPNMGPNFDINAFLQPGVFVTLPVGFRHTDSSAGRIEGQMVAPWCIAVNIQITPRYIVTNGIGDCEKFLTGRTRALTVYGRCTRQTGQRPYPFPGIITDPDPNFDNAPFNYGLFREEAGEPNAPIIITKRVLLGWSGNGIDRSLLFVLNPAWFVNGFLDNYPPFKRVPFFKKMVQFIRFITGGKVQYESLGVDPETGWEYYPVPVIVGADGSGFPVYGDPVYGEVASGKANG